MSNLINSAAAQGSNKPWYSGNLQLSHTLFRNKTEWYYVIVALFAFGTITNAQPWKQLGMGAGGQIRALYIDDKGNGTSDFYVGSDVAGVWKTGSISNGSLNDFTKYNYEYISNHEIMRFVNKFYRSAYAGLSDYIFTCNQSGIHKIERNATNGNMQKIVDIEESDVSDMHIASLNTVTSSHSLYFVTGDTRLDDDANVKATGVYDFYFTTITPAGDINTPIQGVNFTGLGGQRDVYCLYVNDKGTPDETDDEFLAGTENGLYMFNFGNLNFVTHSVAATLVSPPLNSGAYSVSSITAFTPTQFVVTIYGATSPGIFLFSTTQPYWPENYSNGAVFESSKVANSTIKYSATSNELKGFAKLQRLTSNAGYLVFLTEPDTKFGNPLAKYYTGIYYAEADAGNSYKPKNSWANLEFDNSTNDYGWNNSRPCANINSCVLNTLNRLWVGKSGNFFVTDNIINNAGSVWKQIYTTANTGCTTTIMSYSNRGMVNTVPNAIFPDPFQPTRIFNCNYDRHLNVSNNYGRSFEQVTISNVSPGSSCFWIDDSYIDYSLCNITDPTFSDCFTITNNPYDNQNFSLYTGFAQGYSTKKGVGVAYELNNGSNIITPFGGTVQVNVNAGEVCGDPIKIVFNPALPNDKYCIYNMTFPPTDRHLFKYNVTTFAWDELNLFAGNEDIIDAVITNIGDLVVINGNTNARGVHKFTWVSNVWTYIGTPINANILGVQLEPFLANGKTYLICKATGQTGGNVTVIDANTWTVLPVNVQCGTASMDAFNNLIGDDDRTSCIGISEAAYSIYISTAKGNRTYLYKGSYNPTTGEVLPCWDEITGMPNKIPKYINTNRCTAAKENLYVSMRGLGEWQYCPTPFTLTATNPTCNGGNNGTATAAINCDRYPYNYLWNTSATSSTLINLAAGTYTVTVTDGYGATSTQSITLNSPCCGNIILSQTNFDNATTFGIGTYNLNNNVICKANITINTATINIAGNVSITVPFGFTLTIENGSNLSACTNMWQGIVNQGGTVIVTGSTISDAIIGIENLKNGNGAVNNNIFDKNYTSLSYNNGNYATTKGVSIWGNTFKSGYNLKAPYFGMRSSNFIRLSYVTDITIGDVTKLENTFGVLGNYEADNGIYATTSSLKVYHNKFYGFNLNSNITLDAGNAIKCYTDMGVMWQLGPHTPTIFNALIGDKTITNSGNFFIQCKRAIDLVNQSATIDVNTITNNANTPITEIDFVQSIYVHEGTNFDVAIEKNEFINNDKGISIDILGNVQGAVNIQNQNHFNNFPTNISKESGAIRASDYIANSEGVSYNIFNNKDASLALADQGIHTKGDFGIKITGGYVTIQENSVYLDHITTPTNDVFGVRIENSITPQVTCNLARGESATTTAKKIGMSTAFSYESHFDCNTTDKTQVGMEFLSDCDNSVITGNSFQYHDIGFRLGRGFNGGWTSGIIGDQNFYLDGLVKKTFGNRFEGTNGAGGFTIASMHSENSYAGLQPNLGFRIWLYTQGYFEPKPPYTVDNSQVIDASAFAPSFSPSITQYYSCPSNCQSLNKPKPVDDMEEDVVDVEATDTTAITGALRIQNNSRGANIYNELSIDTMRRDTNIVLSNFYNQRKTANTGKLADAEILVASLFENASSTNQLNTLLQSIVPQYEYEQNSLDILNLIIAKKGIINAANLSNNERQAIEVIASQCPYKGGKAVYKARTMVWLYNPGAKFIDDELCTNGAYFRQTNSENNSSNLYADITVIPNPSNDLVTLYYFTDSKEKGKLKIYNETAQLIKSYPIFAEKNSIELSVQDLISGIYNIQIVFTDRPVQRTKLVVIK